MIGKTYYFMLADDYYEISSLIIPVIYEKMK